MSCQKQVDQWNSAFYGRFQYPPPPAVFERVRCPGFWRRFLGQDIGDWEGTRLPGSPRIWVAGCGTNQAIVTALKFPEATVVATDLSQQSLETAARNARALGISNLELRRESIHETSHSDEFDFVICTGVIHHTADPQHALTCLGAALKRNGVLELMVYNTFHRLLTRAFQAAVRTFAGTTGSPDWNTELPIAQRLAQSFRTGNLMSGFLAEIPYAQESLFADSLLQPVEEAYTIKSLDRIASKAGLELLHFSVDQFSRAMGATDWNIRFEEPLLREKYEVLGDLDRWEVANQMLGESSPMLWFYLQRSDSEYPRKTERELATEFQARNFTRTQTEKEMFGRGLVGYSPAPRVAPFPGKPVAGDAARFYAALNGTGSIQEALAATGLEPDWTTLHRLRVHLATSAFPFLLAT